MVPEKVDHVPAPSRTSAEIWLVVAPGGAVFVVPASAQ